MDGGFEKRVGELVAGIRGPDERAAAAARERQARLAKPPGSLGKLEELSIQLAGITGRVHNRVDSRRVLVFAADNGVVAEGVSSAPQSVTLAQTVNLAHGKAGCATLCRAFGCGIEVYDVGVASDVPDPLVHDVKIRHSTGNIAEGPAMTREEAARAVIAGAEAARKAARDGVQALGVGEMGIGNTTTSSAVLAVLAGAEAADVTGRGGGITDRSFEKKLRVVRRAIERNAPDPADPLGVLAKVGGLDIAAMCGAFLGAAECRVPAVVDGFISIVAALAAVRLAPAAAGALVLSHASYEIGYKIAADALGLSPMLLLGMRLGEGSGCPIAFEVLKAACAILNEMETFEEAGIHDGYLDEIRKVDAFSVKGRGGAR